MYKMMTPGPTQVRENVRMARSLEFQNPDLDADFCEYYKETCLLASELLHTKNDRQSAVIFEFFILRVSEDVRLPVKR